jgi:hypothetical protein
VLGPPCATRLNLGQQFKLGQYLHHILDDFASASIVSELYSHADGSNDQHSAENQRDSKCRIHYRHHGVDKVVPLTTHQSKRQHYDG